MRALTRISMVGRTLSHYRILEKLGEGGMGAVYAAHDMRLKRKVALKVLPQQVTGSAARLERFQREAEALAALNHPGIVVIHSVEEAEGVHFLTMELVEGTLLSDLIPPRGLALDKLFALAIPLAEALAAAHARGITHRDLKPGNIMVTDEERRVKVLDLGLAKLHEADESDANLTAMPTAVLTAEGTVLGTLPYMSPEQAEGKPVDHRTDIFSLGIILYELATGERPFKGETAARLTSSILTEAPRPLHEVRAEVPRQLERIIGHCLEKEPRERFQSALDVHNELKQLERELRSAASARSDPALATPSSTPASRRAVLGVAVALMVLSGGVGAYFWRSRAPSPSGAPATVASIVALPAEVFGADSEAYLTDAIPSTLSTHLVGLEGIDTKLPPTANEVGRIGGDLEKLSAAYEVGAFVRSTVTVEGAELVLSLQVVDTTTRSLLWGAEYRGRQDAYLELVRRGAGGVRDYLRPQAGIATTATGLAANSEAELALERGRYVSRRFGTLGHVPDFEIALSSFERALELDPGLAAAALEIGSLHVFRWQAERRPELLDDARGWFRRALDLDPMQGGVWSALAYIENYSPDGPDPKRALRYALKGAALDPLAQFAIVSVAHTVANWSLELGIEANLESTRKHPLYLAPGLNAGDMLVCLGRADRGLRLQERALEIEPQLPWGHYRRSLALTVLGRFDEAEAELRNVARAIEAGALPEWARTTSVFTFETERALAAGRLDEATRLLDELLESPDELVLGSVVYLGWQFSRRGATEQTVALLLAAADLGIQLPYDWWQLADGLDDVRADPRMAEVVDSSRRSFEEFVEILQDAREHGELPHFLEEALTELLARLELADGGRA